MKERVTGNAALTSGIGTEEVGIWQKIEENIADCLEAVQYLFNNTEMKARVTI